MSDSSAAPYRVLARKYRPETFADLIGQEAMVRILRNAFAADRIAHAFIMTGIRGTGKTSTARIIAKGLNCIGPDGAGGPTTEPCGVCEHCRAIAEGRHVDVLEMDAASRTGVGDIREIIESVRYRAAAARYKVYIIDEVHMLSTSAFNALLKTLEEPPEHVKFIFATTEIRKVPVTVLSRCQRFDLRRIEPEQMIAHLSRIAAAEGAQVAPEALALITRAAEGSVRDAVSLLDQAIAHGAGETGPDEVRAMLGLADRGRVLDLFDMIMRGDAAGALGELAQQYAEGADPLAMLRDLAEVTHWISVVKITPDAAEDPTVGPDERRRGREMAAGLSMRVLARAWQMLLRALEEVERAPNTMMAAEMAIIRLTHVAELPPPEDLLRRLAEGGMAPGPAAAVPPDPGGAGGAPRAFATADAAGMARAVSDGKVAALAVAPAAAPAPGLERFARFEQVVELIRANRDMTLLIDVERGLRLHRYQPGRIAFTPSETAPADLAPRLQRRLSEWTGQRWGVTVVSDATAPTIAESREAQARDLHATALAHPLVQAALAAFPGAELREVRPHEPGDPAAAPGAPGALSEAPPGLAEDDTLDDDWDPFEET